MEQFIVIHTEETADINETVFLAAHRTAVRIAEHFMYDFFDGLIRITRLLLFNKVSVFYTACCIIEDFDAVLLCQSAYFFHVFERNGLTSCKVDRNG